MLVLCRLWRKLLSGRLLCYYYLLVYDQQMPKLKTNSSVKKRFKVTGAGKVLVTQSGKRHNMRKRCNKMLSKAKGRVVATPSKMKMLKRAMPYSF